MVSSASGDRPSAFRSRGSAGLQTCGGLIAGVLDAALAIVMAPACASCGSVLESPCAGPVCDACWRAIPSAVFQLHHSGSRIATVASAGAYDGALRDIIHAWKFERRQRIARPLAALIRARCSGVFDGADVLVPVPMTPWRKWHRGFNQAEELAAKLEMPVTCALARWRPRPAQSTLPQARRRINLGASIFVPAWRRRAVRGRIVVVVDDVVTTGATLEACAAALHEAGAKEVRAVTVARTLLKSTGAPSLS